MIGCTPAALAFVAPMMAVTHTAGAADAGTTAQARGALVYSKYCVLCHGESGKGDGRAASMQKARPADLTASRKSESYRLQIVRNGGAAMNRSGSMPAWSDVLSPEQITDVVRYLEVVASKRDRAQAATTATNGGGNRAGARQ